MAVQFCVAGLILYSYPYFRSAMVRFPFPNSLFTHKKLRRPLLYQLFTEALHISPLVEPNQTTLGFVITNDKPSYVAKEDSIRLFSVAREAALNKQIIPCVPLGLDLGSIS